MKNHFKQYTAAMLAAVLTLSAGSTLLSVSAETKTEKIVVIGDSISTGAGLGSGEKSYVDIIKGCENVEVNNLAYDTCTTGTLLADLEGAEMKKALSDADVIVVSVGIHDMMDPFIVRATELKEEFGFQKFTDVFTANLADYGMDEAKLLDYNDQLKESLRVNDNYVTAGVNMTAIAEKLSAYSNAKIVYQNVYNIMDKIDGYEQLSPKRQNAVDIMIKNIQYVTSSENKTTVNSELAKVAAQYPCTILDVKSGFAEYSYKYTNLEKLDLNPSAEGHQWIAGALMDTLGLELPKGMKGDVNGDKHVDATDAAKILQHAAQVGAGGEPLLSEDVLPYADVDGTGKADATDAAKILIYAAMEGAGETPSWT